MSDERRVAVVTGGAGAIGSAVVSALEESGHVVAVIDRHGGIECDLASESSTREAAATVLSRYGRCDVLVHCAGVFDAMGLADIEESRWRALMAVNVESSLWLAQAFTPGMIERQFGRIVLISSDGHWAPPTADFLPYLASKAALDGIVRTLAVSLGGHGVAVTAVAPGLTDTPLARSVVEDGVIEAVVAAQAMKRPLLPSDTASTVAFLASDGAEALTGQVLTVNGGAIMR